MSEGLNVVDALSGASGPIASPDRYLILKKEGIPTACTNSAVDINSLAPKNWDAVQNNSVAVNVNYRGQVEGDLILQLVYSETSYLFDSMVETGTVKYVGGMSQSNVTLSMDIKSDHSSTDVLDIYVLMYEDGNSVSNLVSYGRLNMGNMNLSYDPDASLNTDCLTCISTELLLYISPFD